MPAPGFAVCHECIRQWQTKLLPVMGEALRKPRHGIGRSSGQSWYADETDLKVQGRWCYLYRASADELRNFLRSRSRRFLRHVHMVIGVMQIALSGRSSNALRCEWRS
jgi:transposase-like protein